MTDKNPREKRAAVRLAYAQLAKALDFAKENQTGEDQTKFTPEARQVLRTALQACVNHIIDDLEAYKVQAVGGSALAGHNAIGVPRMVPVRMLDLSLNSSGIEFHIKATCPAAEESDIAVPPHRSPVIAR